MGKVLDIAFVSAASFLGMFILLLFTDKDIRIIALLSAISSFCTAVLINFFIEKRRTKRRLVKRKNAKANIKSLIYRDLEDALEKVYTLLSNQYRLDNKRLDSDFIFFNEGSSKCMYALFVFRKYKVSMDDIVSVWRRVRKDTSVKKIIIAVPGKMDSETVLLSMRMTKPEIRFIDKKALVRLAKKHDMKTDSSASQKRIRFSQRLKIYINRKRTIRYSAYALLLLVYYLSVGRILYLIFSAFLAFLSVFSLLSKNEYESLFD